MLPVLFIVIPALEMGLLVYLSGVIGWEITLGIVVVTGLIGAYLVKRQGTNAWRAIGAAFQQGKLPAGELADGALILVGGAFLLTPGLLTDLVGFSLMAPLVRRVVRDRLTIYVQRRSTR
ncbi:MAG: FxsA family protein [Acidimicrobiia bacterium]|nr:FxsA family protein [Acidimicrobiia bacterium]